MKLNFLVSKKKKKKAKHPSILKYINLNWEEKMKKKLLTFSRLIMLSTPEIKVFLKCSFEICSINLKVS